MATRNGIMARAGMIVVAIVGVGEGDDDKTRSAVGKERKAQGGGRSAWIKTGSTGLEPPRVACWPRQVSNFVYPQLSRFGAEWRGREVSP
jgi:hypothetical protein